MGLQAIIIEDDPNDVIRIQHELARGGLDCRLTRVETREEFLDALRLEKPQLILSDHGLPSFDGFAALDLAQKVCPQVPFIFVTGSFSQAMLLEMFEAGAAGYVYKNRINEIVPAVMQALKIAHQEKPLQAAPPPVAPRRGGSPAGQPAPSTLAPSMNAAVSVVCPICKRVRSAAGIWEPIEVYLQNHKQATVTLARCPDCQPTEFKPILYRR